MTKYLDEFDDKMQEFYARKVDRSTVVTAARQAAQTAEDARAIAAQRQRDAELAQAHSEASREQQLREQAEADAQRARAQSSAERRSSSLTDRNISASGA